MTTASEARRVRIGLQVQPQFAEYDAIRSTVARAEELGVDLVATWDHFYPLGGDHVGKHFECWTMLAAWAATTERVELSALVTCNSYRNPDLLADMARTVDHVSGGRLILGIGSGWFEKDYDNYGYDFGTAGSRLAALGEALPRIERRWAALDPPPTRRIPVLIGGGGERKTLRLVARHADYWHGFGDVETMQHKSRVLDEWCAKEGRDPAAVVRTTSSGRVGSFDRERVDALHRSGFGLFTVSTTGPDYDLSGLTEALRWRDEVNAGLDTP
jgi:probable F420-dependent oxidoreductase